ncbi:MAG: DinB family protein [Dehalococcoidia bacterium]|nr:DinB family protein [Dehalococcoidia bacterium]
MRPLEVGTIELLTATLAVLAALLAGLPSAAVEMRDAGGWSPRDLVAHLTDRGRIQRARVERLIAAPGATIEDSDEHATLAASGLRSRPLAELLATFARERAVDVQRYATLSPERLADAGVHSAAGAITAAQLIHQAAYHDLQHVRQIAATLAVLPDAGRGPFAMFG